MTTKPPVPSPDTLLAIRLVPTTPKTDVSVEIIAVGKDDDRFVAIGILDGTFCIISLPSRGVVMRPASNDDLRHDGSYRIVSLSKASDETLFQVLHRDEKGESATSVPCQGTLYARGSGKLENIRQDFAYQVVTTIEPSDGTDFELLRSATSDGYLFMTHAS
jgi:hypothetical protein